MRPDEVMQVMNDPVAQELLATRTPARFAYIGLDGAPRVVPVGIHWNNEALVIGSAANAAKVPAVRANPKVALTIDTNTPPQKVLLVRGTARVEVVEGVPDEYLAGAMLGEGQSIAEFEQQVRALYDEMAKLTITPEWAKVLDFAAGRIPKSVEELAVAKFG